CLSTISWPPRVSHNVVQNLVVGLHSHRKHPIRQVSVSDCLAHDKHCSDAASLYQRHQAGIKSCSGNESALQLPLSSRPYLDIHEGNHITVMK
ncbi:hypothetical protein CCMA1212_005993, partial [Trichoderma ghanense]